MRVIRICLLSVLLSAGFRLRAELVIEAFGRGSSTYWLIYDDEKQMSDHLIVFLHGYGASNPGCYGGWIQDLVAAGNVVLFPKFQSGLWLPDTEKFQQRVDRSVELGVKYLNTDKGLKVKKISFISHSIGGVISANLADEYGRSGAFEVAGLVLVQPGASFMPLGRKVSYKGISPTTAMLAITGDDDRIAGDDFVRYLFDRATKIPDSRKLHLVQYTDRHGGEKVTSHHKDPVSPSEKLNTGNFNPVIGGSYWLGESDQVDREVYWRLSRMLMECINNNDLCEELFQAEPPIRYSGEWEDGSEIRLLNEMDR